VAQRVERSNRQPPRGTGARLHHLREHERCEVGHVLGEFAQRRQAQGELGEPRPQVGIEVVLLRQAPHVERRKRHQPHLVLLGARQQEFEAALLAAREPREVGEKQDPAGRLGEKLGGRLGEELRARQEGRARRGKQPREQFRSHAALAAQQERRGRLRELRQPLFGVGERRRAPERRERELRRRGRLGAAQRALHGGEEPLQRHGLLQEVERADARCLDRGLDRGMARHHHHGHGELPARSPFLQQRDAVRGPASRDIEQHEIGRPRSRRRASPGSSASITCGPPSARISDSSSRMPTSSSTTSICAMSYAAFASGSSTLTDAPRVGRFSIATLP
jgi:hypothetical protein